MALPTKKVRGSQNPWMTSAISKLMSTRDYYQRKAKRSGRDEDWTSYRLFRNKVAAAIRYAKSDYNRNLIHENLDNPRVFYREDVITIACELDMINAISAADTKPGY